MCIQFAFQQSEGQHHVEQCKAYSMPLTVCDITCDIGEIDMIRLRTLGHSATHRALFDTEKVTEVEMKVHNILIN